MYNYYWCRFNNPNIQFVNRFKRGKKKINASSRGSNNTIYSGWLTGAGVHIQGRAF